MRVNVRRVAQGDCTAKVELCERRAGARKDSVTLHPCKLSRTPHYKVVLIASVDRPLHMQ